MALVASTDSVNPGPAALRKVSGRRSQTRSEEPTMDTVPQLAQERSAPPATLVIFGASGDLTRRKLLPAVESLARHHRLPAEFALVGVARTPMSDEQFAGSALGDRDLCDRPQLQNGGIRYVSGGYDD